MCVLSFRIDTRNQYLNQFPIWKHAALLTLNIFTYLIEKTDASIATLIISVMAIFQPSSNADRSSKMNTLNLRSMENFEAEKSHREFQC